MWPFPLDKIYSIQFNSSTTAGLQEQHYNTALYSSLGSLGQIVNGIKTLEISGTVYIRPFRVYTACTATVISSVFLPFTICLKLPSERAAKGSTNTQHYSCISCWSVQKKCVTLAASIFKAEIESSRLVQTTHIKNFPHQEMHIEWSMRTLKAEHWKRNIETHFFL